MKASLLKTQRGFTLIEVMVALFILTVGMLGSTSMMLRSQQKAQETNVETNAAQSAWNIAELLRLNITAVNAGSFNTFDIAAAPPSAPPCLTLAGGCENGALLDMIKYFVQLEFDENMKGKGAAVNIAQYGVSSIPVDDKSTEEEQIAFQITLTWNELGKVTGQVVGAANYQKTYQMIFEP